MVERWVVAQQLDRGGEARRTSEGAVGLTRPQACPGQITEARLGGRTSADVAGGCGAGAGTEGGSTRAANRERQGRERLAGKGALGAAG